MTWTVLVSLVAVVADDGRESILPLLQQKTRGSRLPYYKISPIRIRDFLTASDAAFFAPDYCGKFCEKIPLRLSFFLFSSLSIICLQSDMQLRSKKKNI